MSKKIRFLFGLAFICLLAAPAYAQEPWPPQPQHTDPYWQVSYWNNMTLSGNPSITGTDANLDHNWGSGSPHANVPADRFSARWKRYIDVSAGTYRFTATSDDGMRVYVDDRLIIDQWHDHPARTYTADVVLTAGHHLVTVEYYENTGYAVAKVTWAPAPTTIHNWRGEYFGNRSLSGSPTLTRDDANIDFNWAYGSPASTVPSDGFSARWTRTVHFEPGSYRFTTTTDDGARLWVNDHLLIDKWRDQPYTSYSGTIYVAGDASIKMEYYENGGAAAARLTWVLDPGTPTPIVAWRGEYFNNRWLSGSPVLVRDDATIDFNWVYGSPASAIPSDGFSVRWTRTIRFEPGSYRFTATTDDGVRLWVDGHLLIDKWRDQPYTSHSGTTHISGDVPVKMAYYENGGAAAARLLWTRVEDEPPPPSTGTIIVDDTDQGLVTGGSASGWHTAAEGYGGRLLWTRNGDRVRYNYNWARWYPNLLSGRYEVFVYIPERYTTTSSARYWVSHRDGFTLRRVDQSANGDRWVSLGTYWFRGTNSDYVSLADVTFESHASRLVGFDAVKWEPR